jgi:hypothetical protein
LRLWDAYVQMKRDQRDKTVVLHQPQKEWPIQMARALVADDLEVFLPPQWPASAEQEKLNLRRPAHSGPGTSVRTAMTSFLHLPPASRRSGY